MKRKLHSFLNIWTPKERIKNKKQDLLANFTYDITFLIAPSLNTFTVSILQLKKLKLKLNEMETSN